MTRRLSNSPSRIQCKRSSHSSVLGPFILATNLLLLLGRKVILDIECLANLLRRLALDHVGHSLAANVKQRLDIEVIGSLFVHHQLIILFFERQIARKTKEETYEDNLKEHLLINLHILLIPLLNVRRLFARVGLFFIRSLWVVAVVLAPFENLFEDRLLHLFAFVC